MGLCEHTGKPRSITKGLDSFCRGGMSKLAWQEGGNSSQETDGGSRVWLHVSMSSDKPQSSEGITGGPASLKI